MLRVTVKPKGCSMRNSVFIMLIVAVSITLAADPQGVVEWKKRRDLATDRFVWQITSHDSASEAVYFENQPFTHDDRYVVFGSKRTGDWKIYRADLETGEIMLVTDREDPGRFTIGPDGEHVWYIDQKKLYKTHVADLRETLVMDFSDRFSDGVSFSRSFTNDGKYTLITTRSESSRSIYRVNLETKQVELALEVTEGWFSHPQICPTNPDLIAWVPGPDTQNDMSLPMEERARNWLINMKTGENKQFLTMPYGYRATHETWSADGERFFFFKKKVPGWTPVAICSQDQDGSNFREYYTHDNIRLGHGLASSDGEWFVTDGQDPGYNPLILINLITGEEIFLCWPNASIDDQHVHPSISKSGRFVCYTSDVTGTSQVYVVPTGIK